MGFFGRIGAFIGGGLIGAGVGAAVAMLVAPQSGEDFREEVENRVDQAKAAGLEAQARTEEELIRRFRADTGDPAALRAEEAQLQMGTAPVVTDPGRNPVL
jgi:gas vesicle protein